MAADWTDPQQIGTGESASFEALQATIGRSFKIGLPTMAMIAVALTGATTALGMGGTLIALVSALLEDQGSWLTLAVVPVSFVYGVFAFFATIALSALTAGQHRPLRQHLLKLDPPEPGFASHFREVRRPFIPTLLTTIVIAVVVGIGFCLCVLPGFVAAFFLAPALYLVAAADVPVGDALMAAPRIVLNNLLLFAALAVFGVVVLGALGAVVVFAQGLIGVVLAILVGSATGPQLAQLAFDVVLGAIAMALAYPSLATANGIFVAIEAADRGLTLAD